MKSPFFKFIALYSVASLLISCGCTKLYFDKDDTYWTDAYETGDKIVFKSDYPSPESKNRFISHTDTLFIEKKRIELPTGECSISVSEYDPEGRYIDYKYLHEGKLSDSDYFVQHVKEPKKASIPVLRVYGLEYSGDKLKDTVITLSTLKIKLNDCYTFNKKDCYEGWSAFPLKTFVWSKKMGLVLFIGKNGEKFELAGKIKK